MGQEGGAGTAMNAAESLPGETWILQAVLSKGLKHCKRYCPENPGHGCDLEEPSLPLRLHRAL